MTQENKELSPEETRKLVVGELERTASKDFLASEVLSGDPYLFGKSGQKGAKRARNAFFNSEYVTKLKFKLQKNAEEKAEKMGLRGNYDYSQGDGYTAMQEMRIVQEASQMATLGELESIAKETGAKFKFEVPNELKDYSFFQITEKMRTEGGNSLSSAENDAMQLYGVLFNAYKIACATEYVNPFEDINSLGQKIVGKYAPQKSQAE